MIQEIQQLEKQIQTWKNLSMFQDFSKEIAEAEAKIEELKKHKDITPAQLMNMPITIGDLKKR